MTFSKENFLSKIKSVTGNAGKVSVSVELINEHGDECVNHLVALRTEDSDKMSLKNIGISTFLLDISKMLIKNLNKVITPNHFYALRILRCAHRRKKRKKDGCIYESLGGLFKQLLTNPLDKICYSGKTKKGKVIFTGLDAEETIHAFIKDAVKLFPEITIFAVRWLWSDDNFHESLELAKKISDDSNHFFEAQYYQSFFGIMDDSATYDSCFQGFKSLASIPKNHSFYLEKKNDIERLIKKSVIKIKEEREREGNQGFIVNDDMAIMRSSKNPTKVCRISDPDPEETGLTLHERQSLVERIVALNNDEHAWNLSDLVAPGNYNQLVGNIGLIVTDKPWKKGGNHRRVFKTMPISFNGVTIFKVTKGHSEPGLYRVLGDEWKLAPIIKQLKQTFSIKAGGHKVYGVVLDFHSRYDMCTPCYNETDKFYHRWRPTLLKVLKKEGFKVPKERSVDVFSPFFKKRVSMSSESEIEDRSRFTVTMRYTSNTNYEVGQGGKRGKRSTTVASDGSESHPEKKIDLKRSDRHLVVHGNFAWHRRWTDLSKRPVARKPIIPIEKWSVISTSSRPDVGNRMFNYSCSGMLDLRRYSLWQEPDESTSSAESTIPEDLDDVTDAVEAVDLNASQ